MSINELKSYHKKKSIIIIFNNRNIISLATKSNRPKRKKKKIHSSDKIKCPNLEKTEKEKTDNQNWYLKEIIHVCSYKITNACFLFLFLFFVKGRLSIKNRKF